MRLAGCLHVSSKRRNCMGTVLMSTLLAVAVASVVDGAGFSPRMVHSAFGIDSYPDDYLSAVAKAGVDSILVYISDPPDVTRTGKHENIGEIVDKAAKFGLAVYAYADFSVKAAKMCR